MDNDVRMIHLAASVRQVAEYFSGKAQDAFELAEALEGLAALDRQSLDRDEIIRRARASIADNLPRAARHP